MCDISRVEKYQKRPSSEQELRLARLTALITLADAMRNGNRAGVLALESVEKMIALDREGLQRAMEGAKSTGSGESAGGGGSA